MADHAHGNHGASGGGVGRWIFWGFALVAAYFLLTEHRAHTIQYLPVLLLLACPIMHLFHGHGGHGGHDGDGGMDKKGPNRQGAEGREKIGTSHH
jgi:hypothetical protein